MFTYRYHIISYRVSGFILFYDTTKPNEIVLFLTLWFPKNVSVPDK